ncbi:tetratricopeptide repeat protein [Haloferula sp. A504]|uniref:tetratricopeptide repeat protein n=1 Tax=Haloferula sp. A504 TaxID=3373601 RepID=UPI0031C5043B|nr:tetratricopeptide repeat protein [Verrucomicrobiaceae bacterium E54]
MKLLLALALVLLSPAFAANPLLPAERALKAKDFPKAVELIESHLKAGDAKQADYARYLKALALELSGRHGLAVEACDELLDRHPKSEWKRKALYLKSRALVAQKKFEEAEKIYEAEANRLFSSDRKQGLARILVEFADELGRQPEQDELDAPPADYAKALQLYTHALGLEIGRALKDEVQFKIACSHQELQNWPQAEAEFRAYLKEFDPNWAGPVGSPERLRGQLRENPLPAGKHFKEARFHLADVQLAQSGQSIVVVAGMRHQALQVPDDPSPHLPKLQMARQNAEDLIDLLGGKDQALKSDTHWLLVRSYNLPHPAPGELDQAILEARDFLKRHPKHPRATDTSRLIALTYRNFGRTDDAIAAYQDFATGANFTFVPEDGEIDPEIKTGVSCSETFENWTREAVFMIGELRFRQKDYEAAIRQWREYIARFPNGAQWSQCQSGIINAQFQIGIDAVAAKDYDVAGGHFDKFLQDHPLDPRARQILFTLGQIQHAQAVELEESMEDPDEETREKIAGHYRKAVEEWEKLVSKYPNTEESSLALYRIGQVQEEKLGELEQALATYQRLNWGSWSGQASQRFAQLTAHSLSARTERTFRTNEDVFIEVTSRNAPKLTLSQYFLNLEAYFRKTHGIEGIDGLDVDLIQPDKTWEVEVPDYEKFKPTTQRIKIPFEKGKPGVCVIKVTEEDFEATTLVIRSDIDIITKTSRREVLVFAQNRLTNQPAAGVSVIASDGGEVFGTGKTGKDGVFRGKFEERLKDGNSVRIFASSEQGIASYNLDLSNLQLSSGLSARGYVHTEKPTYRPGETVNIRAILRDVEDGSYIVPREKSFDVVVFDPKGRMLTREHCKLSEFGALDASLKIDSQAPLGDYTINVRLRNHTGGSFGGCNGTFAVQRYKLEKVRLAFDFKEPVIFRGEMVRGRLKASYYWGTPAAGEMIDYTLPDGRSYSGRADDKGEIGIEFDPSGFLPGRALEFTAHAKQYNVAAVDQVFLAELGFSVKVKPSQEVALAGEPFDVALETIGADGEPVGRKLTLTVLRREVPKPDRILSQVPWIDRGSLPAAEVTVEEHTVETDPKTGRATQQLTLKKGGSYLLRVSGMDRFEQLVSGQAGIRISDDEDAVKLRFFTDSDTGQVGSKLPIRLHSRLDEVLALLTIEGEEVISHEVLTLKPGFNPVDLVPDHAHYPNFRIAVAAIDGRELRAAHKDLTVERELRVTVKPRRAVEAPGADGEVELVVTDHNGKPVQAELSLALVNEALYALYPERVPPILEFFQSGARRHAGFDLGSTCGFGYTGLTRPVLKTILEEEERLERRKREEAQLAELAEMNRATYGQGAAPMGLDIEALKDQMPAGQSLGGMVANEPTAPRPMSRAEQRLAESGASGEAKVVDGKPAGAPQPRKDVMNASRWLSPIVTDEEGEATVTLPLPESTTQWRLTARGCTRETLVGQATADLITRKDFFLELKTPTIVQEGDRMRFLAKVHNLTNFAGEIEVKLEVGAEPPFVSRRKVGIKANSVTECVFEELEIPLAKRVTLTASSATGKHADTLEIDMPLRPWGMEFAVSDGGVSSGNASAILELSDQREYSWREMELTLSPSLEQALVDFALHTAGSSGQADDLLAAVAALDYAVARDGREDAIRMLRERVRTLVASLTATQQDDGHWQWCGSTDLYLTCRSYWALARAHAAGTPMQPDVLGKTEAYLANRFSSLGTKDNDNKAVILQALSVTGKADFAHLNRIYRERASLSNSALAHTAVAMINLKRDDFASDLVDLLEQKVEFEEGDRRPKIAWWAGHGHTVLQDRNATTALALLAFAGVKPDSPLAEQAANLLLRNQGCFPHHAPGALGPAVAALAAYHGRNQAEQTDFDIDVLVNGRKVASLKSGDIVRNTRIPVPPKALVDGTNVVRFEKKGPGRYHYGAILTGFSADMKNPDSWGHQLRFTGGGFFHDRLSYRGVPLGSLSTSPVTKVEMGQKIRVTSTVSNSYSDARRQYRIRREFLPAGMLLVDGSLSGSVPHHEIGDGMITLYYSPGQAIGDLSYELVAYAPGTYRVLPAIIHDLYNRGRMTLGKPREITVLGPGEKSDDPYNMNRHEHFELAGLNFNDGNHEVALKHLTLLFEKHRSHYERDLARMLLWIYTMEEYFDADQVVEMFEILRERHPDLTIPFDKILAVGKAYRLIGEHERAWLVFRATIDSSFINDASLSAVLEDQGQFLGGIDYMEDIWREYPDTSQVVSSYFALSQQLYEKAPKAHELKAEQDRRRRRLGEEEKSEEFDRVGLLKRSLALLDRFQTLYPEDPLVDDAAFSMANAFFALKDYETVVTVAERFQKRYPKSDFVSSFQYMAALGHFWQLHYDEALASAAPVTEGKSKDRDYARYITAQIHHAQGAPGKAIEWYEKVEGLYPDAGAAIEYFEEEKIGLEEVTTFKPGEEVVLDLSYRNIKEAYLQVYKVDLMKLYLREKNLSKITQVHLAGIAPESELTVELGDGKDYRDLEKKVTLPLEEEGAYLVICRGDNLFTSGMVLVTPLRLEIQESPAAGSLRVNVRDTVDEGYQADVHVKAIGSSDSEFKSGETDLRGIFVAEGLQGRATVIARQEGRYAFYRGTTHLGAPDTPNQAAPQPQQELQQLRQQDFLNNLNMDNSTMQRSNIDGWESLRRGKGGKGVEVQKAY